MNLQPQMRRLITAGLIFLVSCGPPNDKKDNSYYTESRLSFYDPYDNSFTAKKWIRNPENIRIAHESFKKYGYDIILSDQNLFEPPCWIPGLDQYANKACANIIDSLIIHYHDFKSAPTYYNEFWKRRKGEGNDSVVYEVLAEIKAEVVDKKKMVVHQELVNDTIVGLLRIQKEAVTDESAVRHFEYLKSIGLNGSAHNLLYERAEYYGVKWDRKKLDTKLKKDTIRCCPLEVFEDDSP